MQRAFLDLESQDSHMTISAFHKSHWEFLASDLQFLVTHCPIHTSTVLPVSPT